jgi:3-phenylpropionate/trans-cinnamate dioxygenase ferredoxin reductase component
VQNATDHARFLAARITGADGSYGQSPWFWSEQYDRRLQIAGFAEGETEDVIRGDQSARSFSVCRFGNGKLLAIESINAPRDHIAARKLLAADCGHRVSRSFVADPGFHLTSLIVAAEQTR